MSLGNTTLPPSGPRAYRVEGFIGKGGFGHVYLARPLAEGALMRVALKVLDEGAAEPWVARFFHEAQVLASLSDYPCFVRVNAVFKMERRFCIEMEYIPGVTLDTLLERVGKLPLPAALHIARQTAVALDAAWNRARDERGELLRVLHRDLKPANLRLTPAGGVKVLDFGLARSDLRGIRPETLRVLPATLAYMAPERFGFRADFGHPADVYALGLTLYEMVAGESFFDLGTINPCLPPEPEVLRDWTRLRLDRLAHGDEALRPLIPLLESALALEPEARLSAGELESALRRLGGLDLEDEVRLWVEQQLTPVIAGLPTPGQSDAWGWVRTIRRSDVETPPATRDVGPSHETLTPPLYVDRAETLDALARSGPAESAAMQQKAWVDTAEPREERASWVGQAIKLTLAMVALSVGTWLAIPPAEEAPPGAPALPTAATIVQPQLPPVEAAPVEAAPVEAAPVEVAPVEVAPVEVVKTAAPVSAPAPVVPTGEVRMEGDQATGVKLSGPVSRTLRPGGAERLPVGAYTATVAFEGGDYPLEVTVREGETTTFDCTVTRMGSPCQVR